MSTTADLNKRYRQWLHQQLDHAARELGVSSLGEPVFGWNYRTVGARAETADGQRWLRIAVASVGGEGDSFWTGNVEARSIGGVRKPDLLAWLDWSTADRIFRAELMTLVSASAVSDGMFLRTTPELAPTWWTDLHESLDKLAHQDTQRTYIYGEDLRRQLLGAFGVSIDIGKVEWVCGHGDLHWGNLTAPALWILDWEAWGWVPRGFDPAVLYCASLLQPEYAQRVYGEFSADLDSYTGRIAQLAAVYKLSARLFDGLDEDLANPLHALARRILESL